MGKQKEPRPLFDHLGEVAPLVGRPRLALVVDFDGTLSEFAPTPGEATIHPECRVALSSLAPKLARVVVLSGRGARDLADRVGIEGLWYAGNHGAEYIFVGDHVVVPEAVASRGKLGEVAEFLKSKVRDPNMLWEDKGFSIAVHYRRVANVDGVEAALRSALAEAPGLDGLETFWGNKLLEIRPRDAVNKGDAIRSLVLEQSVDAVMFIGDDTTDIDGMRAIRAARDSTPVDTLGVVVVQPGTPKALIELADFRVGSVAEVARYLGWMDGLRNG